MSDVITFVDMNWHELKSMNGLDEVISRSVVKPQLIFKHSTRCYISKSVLRNFENDGQNLEEIYDLVFLDLISHRDVSNAIETRLQVRHESPQVLIVNNSKAVYHTSHEDIEAGRIFALPR
jgi:bacillithiol system protein YtxJ